MTHAELELLRRDLRIEIRAIGLTSIYDCPALPLPFDLAAEEETIATCWEGATAPEWLRPEHFFVRLHADAFLFLRAAAAIGEIPSIDGFLAWLDNRGFRAPSLRAVVETLANAIPARFPLDGLARRIVELYGRREALKRLARADALLRIACSEANEIADELRAALRALEQGADA